MVNPSGNFATSNYDQTSDILLTKYYSDVASDFLQLFTKSVRVIVLDSMYNAYFI